MMVITNKVLNNKKGYILVALFLYNYTKVLVRRIVHITNVMKRFATFVWRQMSYQLELVLKETVP